MDLHDYNIRVKDTSLRIVEIRDIDFIVILRNDIILLIQQN